MFEQRVIFGMVIAGTKAALEKSPNPSLERSMQKAATNDLRQLLGVDPTQLRIDERGWTLVGRSAVAVPVPAATAGATEVSGISPQVPVGKSVTSSASRLIGIIETVAFDTKTRVGYGGMLTFDPTPIVLFRSGDALRDMGSVEVRRGWGSVRPSRSCTGGAGRNSATPGPWARCRVGYFCGCRLVLPGLRT